MARPMWKGTLAFGLVSIPVGIHSAIQSTATQFHIFSPDGKCRLRRKLVCPSTGEEYTQSDTVRGAEIAPDSYVIVDPEELKNLAPESADVIELERFVDLDEIDPIFFNRPYYVIPEKGAEKPYALLHRALLDANKAGMGEFVMRNREYIGCVRAREDIIILNTLRFEDEVRETSELGKHSFPKKFTEKELKLAIDLIGSLTDEFDPSRYTDDYRKEIRAYLKKKKKGNVVELKTEGSKRSSTSGSKAQVLDLASRLQESLQGKKSSKAKKGSSTSSKGTSSKSKKASSSKATTSSKRKAASSSGKKAATKRRKAG